VGREIGRVTARTTDEQLKNQIYFVGGTPAGEEQIFKKFVRPGSISEFGVSSYKYYDQRVTVSETAQSMATKELDKFEVPLTRITVDILDDNQNPLGYDIESIQPGQTIQIQNLKFGTGSRSKWDLSQWDIDVWDFDLSNVPGEVLQIKSVSYSNNKVTLEVADRLPELARRVEDLQKQVDSLITAEIPFQAEKIEI
jgi:hypothetical protein